MDPDVALVDNVLSNVNYQYVYAYGEGYYGLPSETVDMSVTPAALDLEFDDSTEEAFGQSNFGSNYPGVPVEYSVEETLQPY